MSAPADRLLETVADLLVREGYEGVSVRKVATAAGVSIGAVQHHFPTKDAMLTAAMDLASRRFQERLRVRVPPTATATTALRAVADELLGLGPDGRPGSVLWVARLARATVDTDTAARHASEWQEVEDLLFSILRGARTDRDVEWCREQAGALLAMIDGLATAALTEPARMPPDRARHLLEAYLDGL